jgi:hypothetical protein
MPARAQQVGIHVQPAVPIAGIGAAQVNEVTAPRSIDRRGAGLLPLNHAFYNGLI